MVRVSGGGIRWLAPTVNRGQMKETQEYKKDTRLISLFRGFSKQSFEAVCQWKGWLNFTFGKPSERFDISKNKELQKKFSPEQEMSHPDQNYVLNQTVNKFSFSVQALL